MMKPISVVAAAFLAISVGSAGAQSGRSTMTIVDDDNAPAKQPAKVRQAPAPKLRAVPADPKPRAAARPASSSAATDRPFVIRTSLRTDEAYRAVVSKGINAELKRLGCFRMGVEELHGTAFELALKRYIEESGSYTHLAYPPSVVLAELIDQDSGFCLSDQRTASGTVRGGERDPRYRQRVVLIDSEKEEVYRQDGGQPGVTVQQKIPRIRIYW